MERIMSELNIAELVNQMVLEFGNERFLEGWNGQQKRIRNLLGEFGMKLEKEVSDGDNYSLGRYNAISEFIAILDGELYE
jgi:hypothetical protein